jgi:hypothetical protein
VVTHLTTSSPVKGLSYGERTGSRAGLYLWSYVEEMQTASFVSWMLTRVSARRNLKNINTVPSNNPHHGLVTTRMTKSTHSWQHLIGNTTTNSH